MDVSGAIKRQEEMQTKTFTRWWQHHLTSSRPVSLFEDVKGSTLLPQLIEALEGRAVSFKLNVAPKSCFERLENHGNALEYLANAGVKLVNISAEDLDAGKQDLILGLTWALILKYGAHGLKQDALAEWVLVTAGTTIDPSHAHPLALERFLWERAFRDGRLFAAIVRRRKLPGGDLDLDALQSDSTALLSEAFAAALRRGAPRLLSAVDVAQGNVDAQSIVAYVSLLRVAMGEVGEAVVLQRVARGKASRRRAQLQRERVNTIFADEEERWRGRVSAAPFGWGEQWESDGWESDEYIYRTDSGQDFAEEAHVAFLSHASTRCASPHPSDDAAADKQSLLQLASEISYPRIWDFPPVPPTIRMSSC